jgi:cytochrome c biogenesis protein CcdA
VQPDAFTEALSKGPLYAALAALAGGFVVSLTPCVYPMVAVTVSVFGAREAKSRWEGAALSGAFVLGIMAMFVPLGVVAGLTGSMFGSVLQSRWVVIGMAALFLLLAASLFGAFELALPSALTNRLATLGGIGYKGAFLLGLACGLIASPCTGPVLTGILTWIAKTKSAPLGALAMGAFALGLGIPFFAVGTFAVQLPKSGRWMVHVKSILGVALVVVSLYFLSTVFPALSDFAKPGTTLFAGAGVAVVLGILLGAIHHQAERRARLAEGRRARAQGAGRARKPPTRRRFHGRLVRRLQGARQGDVRGPGGRRRDGALPRREGGCDERRRSGRRSDAPALQGRGVADGARLRFTRDGSRPLHRFRATRALPRGHSPGQLEKSRRLQGSKSGLAVP